MTPPTDIMAPNTTSKNPLGRIGKWPVFAGYPIRPALAKRGVLVTVCTHWQANVDAYASSAERLAGAIDEALELAIKSLESCTHTPDLHGLRAYSLVELRAGRPALVPHPKALTA